MTTIATPKGIEVQREHSFTNATDEIGEECMDNSSKNWNFRLLSHPNTSKSTFHTISSTFSESSSDSEGEDGQESLIRTATSNCPCSASKSACTETNIEATLTRYGVSVCSCIKSLKIERKILRRNSSSDLSQSGAQLLAAGDYRASLLRYQLSLEALKRENCENSYEIANLCYTCGQLCRKINDYTAAAAYFQEELEYTTKFTATGNPTASTFMCMAKCCNALARLHQYDRGDSKASLEYYQQALSFEVGAFETLRENSCQTCGSESEVCKHKLSKVRYLKQQIQDTKRNIGRIYFQDGNVDQALQLTMRN